jgi:hypothetical protein
MKERRGGKGKKDEKKKEGKGRRDNTQTQSKNKNLHGKTKQKNTPAALSISRKLLYFLTVMDFCMSFTDNTKEKKKKERKKRNKNSYFTHPFA